MEELVLEVDSLRKVFRGPRGGAVTAVDGVTFTVRRGEVVGLLGPNGAGKTTTIKCVLGLMTPDVGSIRILGADLRKSYPGVLRHVGAVLEGSRNIYWRMTVLENVQFFAGLHGIRPSEGRARFDELLERFGLQDKRDVEVRKLSHGMKQKTSVVCALARRTPLVFLDEPTLGLDVETSLELRNTLREYATNEGRTVVVSSHDMDVIQDLCGRVIIMSRGRVVTDDTVDHLRRLFRTRTCGIRLGAAPEAADAEGLAAELGARFAPADVSGAWVRATLSGGDDIYELMDLLRARRLAIEEVTYEAPDLEQVFLEVVRRANGVKQAEGAGVEG